MISLSGLALSRMLWSTRRRADKPSPGREMPHNRFEGSTNPQEQVSTLRLLLKIRGAECVKWNCCLLPSFEQNHTVARPVQENANPDLSASSQGSSAEVCGQHRGRALALLRPKYRADWKVWAMAECVRALSEPSFGTNRIFSSIYFMIQHFWRVIIMVKS